MEALGISVALRILVLLLLVFGHLQFKFYFRFFSYIVFSLLDQRTFKLSSCVQISVMRRMHQ